jgi:hypothetical protein
MMTTTLIDKIPRFEGAYDWPDAERNFGYSYDRSKADCDEFKRILEKAKHREEDEK